MYNFSLPKFLIFSLFLIFAISLPAKNVLFVCGELSGDKIGSWYLKRLKKEDSDIKAHAIGGKFLASEGASLIEDYNSYSMRIIGLSGFIKNITKVWKLSSFITRYIKDNNIDSVVLIDFPLVNVSLARYIKKHTKNVSVTYIAPPELWAWGNYWISSLLKKYCDKVIVIYPFEVEFYKNLGLEVEFIEYPHMNDLEKFFTSSTNDKECTVALLVGSRKFELDITLPLLAPVVKKFKLCHAQVKFMIPLAESLSIDYVHKKLKKNDILGDVEIVTENKNQRLSKCFCAITKPGTSTLELAILKVPSIVICKISFIQFALFKLLSSINFVSLPNILSGTELFQELTQERCTSDNIFFHTFMLYTEFKYKPLEYAKRLSLLESIYTQLKGNL